MSKIKIEYIPVNELIPYAKNPRKNDAVVDRMVASITEFGFKIPILAKKNGEVIDGHLRLKAGLKMGIKEVPVVYCDDLSETQIKTFRLLVNQSANWADWDNKLLNDELKCITQEGGDIKIIGFGGKILTEIDFGNDDGIISEDKIIQNKVNKLFYTPKNEMPSIEDLLNTDAADKIIDDIDKMSLSQEFKDFCKKASSRFYDFEYDRIADYYSTTNNPEEKKAIELLCLVIVDYKKTIEKGLIKFSKRLQAFQNENYYN